MAYEDIFPYLGAFGRYQKYIYFLLCLTNISCALHKLAGVFLQAKIDHRCSLPFESNNATYQELPRELYNMTYPWDTRLKAWSSCKRLDGDFSDEYFMNNIPSNRSVRCDNGWIYDTTTYQSSTVIEWDLVCDKAWLRATADSMFMLGDALGSVTFGFLSDKFGRRPIFFLALIMQLVAGFLVAMSPTYLCFMLFRFLVGITASGMFLVAFVIAMEMVAPSKRVMAGIPCQFFFTSAYVFVTAFSYFINDWRWLQVAFTMPALFFLSYWWIIPESARWLLSNGREEEGKAVILKAARKNQVVIPKDVINGLMQKEDSNGNIFPQGEIKKPSFLDLMKYPVLRRRAFYIFFIWFVNNCTYYGLSWSTSDLGGNNYLNFLISGAVEIPAYTFLLLTLNRWGRKSILCGSMLAGGAALLLTIAVPTEEKWLIITLAMVGKLAVTASYGTIYIVTAEHFPTVIRNVALGASSTCARAGGITAPYINLLADVWKSLPLLVFGGLITIGGLLALQLPETVNKKLPDTFEEGEAFEQSIFEETSEVQIEESKK